MKMILHAPFPFIIGLDPAIFDEEFEIPDDVNRVDLDKGVVYLREMLPKVHTKEMKNLIYRLRKAYTSIQAIPKPDPVLLTVDQAFNVVFLDPDEKN
jgi:hypothetical protein